MTDSLQPAAQALEEKLQYLRKKGVLADLNPNLDPSLAPTAQKLSELLTIESKKEDNKEIATSLQAVAKKLERSRNKDTISQHLKQKGISEQSGVDTTVLASLRATAKMLDQSRKHDGVSYGLQQRGTAEQSGVDTSIAASLQATARALEQARTRDAVSYQLQQRGTAAQAGIDQNIAPSLQSIAQQLEMKQKQLAMKQHLQARPDQQELLDQNVLYANANAIAPNLQGASADLRRQLGLRESQQYTQNKGLLLSPTLLINPPNTAPLQGKQSNVAPNLQAAAKGLEYKQRMLQLNRGLQARANADELRDSNILKYNNVARQLQTARTRGAVNSGFQRHGDYSEYVGNSNVSPGLQGMAKKLEYARRQDAVSSGLAMRSTAKQLSVDTSIAASLQATAKLLAAQTRYAASSGLGQRGTAEQTGVDMNAAPSLQATAKALEQERKKDGVSSGLQQRGTAQEAGVDTNFAPSLQAAAKRLETVRKKYAGSSQLTQRGTAEQAGIDTRANARKKDGVSSELQQRGVDASIAPSLQAAAKKIAKHHRRQSLSRALDSRANADQLLAKGVLYATNEKVSVIQSSAIDLENSLVSRPKEDQLAEKGIMENAQMESALARQQIHTNNGDGPKDGLSPKSESAPKLQSAIRALEFQQKNLALKRLLEGQKENDVNTRGLQVRFNIDPSVAPALQAASRQLEAEQKRLRLSKQFGASQAAKQEYRENESEIYNLGLASSLRETAQQLAKQKRRDSLTRGLTSRKQREDLINAQILFDDNISPAIQSQAMSLAQQLDYLREKGMVSSILDAKKQIRKQYVENSTDPVMPLVGQESGGAQKHKRGVSIINSKESAVLTKALNERPDSIELVKSGILHATPEVAHAIHDTINQLEGQLGKRLTTEQLRDLGIMGNNPQMANSLSPTAARLAGLLANQMKREVRAEQKQLARSRNMSKDKLKKKLDARQDK